MSKTNQLMNANIIMNANQSFERDVTTTYCQSLETMFSCRKWWCACLVAHMLHISPHDPEGVFIFYVLMVVVIPLSAQVGSMLQEHTRKVTNICPTVSRYMSRNSTHVCKLSYVETRQLWPVGTFFKTTGEGANKTHWDQSICLLYSSALCFIVL